MLAVGGVNTDNAAGVFKSGACGIGIGSGLVKADEVEKFETPEDFAIITERTKKYMDIIASV
jgi:2-keto-3-deoxy-6-phosphogluconate aldolase